MDYPGESQAAYNSPYQTKAGKPELDHGMFLKPQSETATY